MLPDAIKAKFKDSIIRGQYNLLLGSGVCLDSVNGRGEKLRSANTLRVELCTLLGLPDSISLSKASAMLNAQQREEHLVTRYSKCKPGPSLQNLPRYVWRRLFTFNIDNVLEALYRASKHRKQELRSYNYSSQFEPTPHRDLLQVVHLHGWVGDADVDFVFSVNEYARNMSTNNIWMHMLSEILPTEPFIIAGTSLGEPDLEYYLSFRNESTPQRGRGPSLLIEPYPTAATEFDCKRFGLVLVKADFGTFLHWLRQEIPAPPSIWELIVPDVNQLFAEAPLSVDQLAFFTDFECVAATEKPLARTPSPFLYGREPQWSEIDSHVDINRPDIEILLKHIEDIYDCDSISDDLPRLILVLDEAGTGKTTTIKRVAHQFAALGRPVFAAHTVSRIDVKAATAVLSRLKSKCLLLVDGFADHVHQIAELLDDPTLANKLIVIASERSYRREHVEVILGEEPRTVYELSELGLVELKQIMQRYQDFGLVANPRAVKNPDDFARRLKGESIAVVVCRILNDFKPLDAIVDSLWTASKPEDRYCYLIVAISQHCYTSGLRYSMLQSIAGRGEPIGRLFDQSAPLRLAYNVKDEEFVVTLSSIVGERTLLRCQLNQKQLLFDAFVGLAVVLAPHVNRKAIQRRSPEARLAGRLFDADKIVKPMLGDQAEAFYINVQKQWEWNSRYWEQRALLISDTNIEVSLSYARHAVAIEEHPHSLTTLGKLILRSMDASPAMRDQYYDEALNVLSTAIEMEKNDSRVTVHPSALLLNGTVRYIDSGGTLNHDQQRSVGGVMRHVNHHRFLNDPGIRANFDRLSSRLLWNL